MTKKNPKISRLIVLCGLALQCSSVFAEVVLADYYREDAFSRTGGQTASGDMSIWNLTPHTGAQRYVFTNNRYGAGGATETVTFDSNPAPYLRVSAEAWRMPGGETGGFYSSIQAQLSYGFTVTGPTDALVPVRFRGRYEIDNDSWITYTNASVGFSTSGMDFSRPDQVGLFAQCDGSSVGYRCFSDTSIYPSVNSTIQHTMETLGFETETWGVAIRGMFEGVLMAPTDGEGLARANVLLGAIATATSFRDDGRSGTSWAFIDPELSIDPLYLAQFPETQLLMTPGVGRQMLPVSVPVPEPSTLALMLLGLGVITVAARRRKKV